MDPKIISEPQGVIIKGVLNKIGINANIPYVPTEWIWINSNFCFLWIFPICKIEFKIENILNSLSKVLEKIIISLSISYSNFSKEYQK